MNSLYGQAEQAGHARHDEHCGCAPRIDVRSLERTAPGGDGSDVKAAAAPYAVKPIDETAREERVRRLRELVEQRIVVLDGAMGTMIQRHKLDESGYRGERFAKYVLFVIPCERFALGICEQGLMRHGEALSCLCSIARHPDHFAAKCLSSKNRIQHDLRLMDGTLIKVKPERS